MRQLTWVRRRRPAGPCLLCQSMSGELMKRWGIALVTSLVVAGPALAFAEPAQAATGCKVDYTIGNQWQGGFQGGITVQNLGDALSAWSVRFSYASGQKITQSWNSLYSQSGADVTFTNAAWNG